MGFVPRRACLEPGCPEYATYRGRCQAHSQKRDRTINRAGRAIYSTKRWAMLRRHKLSLNPLCEWEGCNELATDVHHRHGVEADPWSVDGLEALCHAHHSALTMAAMRRDA